MNRVYKVIWSKAKHCYVVTSEIAKGYGKSAGSKGVKALLSGLVALSIAMGGYGLADAVVYVDSKVATEGAYTTEVYTTTEADGKFAAKTVEAAVIDVVNTVSELGGEYTALDGKVQAEVADRKAADQNNLKVDGDGVISKVTGDDGTTSSPVNKLVLNKDGNNQITMDENGIKVGKNSTTMDEKGIYAGSDYDYGTAKAALDATEGKIRGAGGKFEVNADGKVTAKGGVDTNGDISGKDITASGDISGGDIQGKSISDGTATMKNGNITGVKNLSAETITTSGDLTVNGKLNMDEIDMNKSGIVGDNNVTASTKVAAGEITSYKKATSTKAGGGEKESAIDYDEKGTSTWAKATDADGKWNKSTLTVEGKGIKSTATDTDGKNKASTNLSNKGFNTFASDGKNKTYTKQTAESLTSQIGDDGKVKSVMNADGITNNADGGTITNSAKDLVNTASENMTNTVDKDLTTTVGGEMKTTVTGKVTEDYQDALETTVGTNETHYVKGNQTNTVDGTLEETVKENVTEDYQKDLSTTVGGNQTTTVTGDSSLSAKNITNTASEKITNQIGNGSAVKSEMTANGITNTAKDGTIYNKSKDILNEASGDIINWADGEIGNVATKITNITGKNTVISDNDGTTFENEDAKTPFVKGGEVNTKITGNKVETGKVLTDDLTVRGASEFVGRADFRNDVYVDNNLFVTGETRTDTLYVDHDGYVDGDLYVAGNIETHDAVLSADSRQVVTGRQLYQTNERVDRLDNRIKKVGANAAALAALRPGDFNPDDKFSIAAGFGSYRNANAAALGLFYRPNENVLLSLGTSFGDGENMVNAGVSVKFGRGKSMAERRKEMADEVSSMRDEMRSQDERIAELEEMLKKQSELIEKLSKES